MSTQSELPEGLDEQDLPEWYDPEEHVIAKNHAIRERANGKIVGVPASGLTSAITEKNSFDFQQIRKEKQLQGLIDAERALYHISPDWYGDLITAMFQVGTSGKGIAQVKAAEFVGRATWRLAGKTDSSDTSPGPAAGGAQINLGPEAVGLLQDMLSFMRDRLPQDTDGPNERE